MSLTNCTNILTKEMVKFFEYMMQITWRDSACCKSSLREVVLFDLVLQSLYLLKLITDLMPKTFAEKEAIEQQAFNNSDKL